MTQSETNLEEWLKDHKNLQFLSKIQTELQQKFGDNWFTAERVIKKTSLKNPKNAIMLLHILEYKKFLVSIVSFKPKDKGNFIYKINSNDETLILSKKTQLNELNVYIDSLLVKKESLEHEISELENINQVKLDI